MGDLKPIKGYHFPNGAYVEYSGNLPAGQKEAVIERVNKHLSLLISTAESNVESKLLAYNDAIDFLGGKMPEYVKDPVVRCVKLIPEDNGYPCGGTHVKHLRDFKELRVTKIN